MNLSYLRRLWRYKIWPKITEPAVTFRHNHLCVWKKVEVYWYSEAEGGRPSPPSVTDKFDYTAPSDYAATNEYKGWWSVVLKREHDVLFTRWQADITRRGVYQYGWARPLCCHDLWDVTRAPALPDEFDIYEGPRKVATCRCTGEERDPDYPFKTCSLV